MSKDTESDCPFASVWLYRYDAKSGACPHCADLDGEYHARTHHSQPFDIHQHDYCRCTWDADEIKGILKSDREEMINRHGELGAQLNEAEANVEFCKSYMEDYWAEYETAVAARDTAEEMAAHWISEAEEMMDEAIAYEEQFEELTEEQRDWVDELIALAESYLARAEEQQVIYEEQQEAAWAAKRKWQNEEDELDKWEKLYLYYKTKLEAMEPCLAYPCLEDEVEAIAGSRLHYDLD